MDGEESNSRPKPRDLPWWTTLGVSKDATLEDITSAYRKLAKKAHPDVWARSSAEEHDAAQRRMKAINAAFEIAKKALYLKDRQVGATPNSNPPPPPPPPRKAQESTPPQSKANSPEDVAKDIGTPANSSFKKWTAFNSLVGVLLVFIVLVSIIVAVVSSSAKQTDVAKEDSATSDVESSVAQILDKSTKKIDSEAMRQRRLKPETIQREEKQKPQHNKQESLDAISESVNWNNRDFSEAIVNSTKAIQLVPTQGGVYYLGHGQAFRRTGELDMAITDFSEAIQIDPMLTTAYTARGQAYGSKSDWDKAISDYSEAIRIDPMYSVAYTLRAYAYESKDEWGKVISDCSEAIRLNPKSAFAYAIRGHAYGLKKEWKKVISDCTKAIHLDETIALAYFCRACAYNEMGEIDMAKEDIAKAESHGYEMAVPKVNFTEAIRFDPTQAAVYYLGRGQAYRSMGELDMAIADFSEVIRINPMFSVAYVARGFAYGLKKEWDKVISDCTEAIRLDVTFTLAYACRSYAYSEKGEMDMARQDIAKARSLGYKGAVPTSQ